LIENQKKKQEHVKAPTARQRSITPNCLAPY